MTIPIIPVIYQEEAGNEEKIRKTQTQAQSEEGKEKETIAQILQGIIGEGDIEGREEEILEEILKEEKRREEEKKRGEVRKRKEEETYVGPLAPRFFTGEKEHTHEKSIEPIKNGCCTKLCKDLNNEIFIREESLGVVIPVFVKHRAPSLRGFISIPYAIDALKDYRYLLNKKDICKCYEETKEIEAPQPIIERDRKRLISARTGKPITLAPGMPKFEPSKTTIRTIHKEDIPTVPTHDGCCAEACQILTNEIDKMESSLDKLEKRTLLDDEKLRHEALLYKKFTLQEYREGLTRKGLCECLKGIK